MHKKCVFLLLLLVLGVSFVQAQTYHYRTKADGRWARISTWERSTNGVDGWGIVPNANGPNYGDDSITIRHNITLGKTIILDETTINQGAQLLFESGLNRVLTIWDGPSDDLIIHGTLINEATIINKGTITGTGTIENKSGATFEIDETGSYNLSGTLKNNGTMILHMKQLTGTVNNYGTIETDRVDFMVGQNLTNHSGSTIKYTSVIDIPASTSYAKLDLSAPGVYYLDGDVIGVEYITLGPNTYLHTNGHTLTHAGCNLPDHIIDGSVISLASSNPAVLAGDISQGAKKHPLYRFTLSRNNTTGNIDFNGLTFITTGNVENNNIIRFQLWTNSIDDLGSATKIGYDITASLGSGSHSFSHVSHPLLRSNTSYFWITVDLTDNASTSTGGIFPKAKTIAVSALTTSSFTVTSGMKHGSTYAGGTQTVVALSTTLSSPNQVPNGNLLTSSTMNEVSRFQILSTGENVLTSLTFKKASAGNSFTASDLDKIQLWASEINDLSTAEILAERTSLEATNTILISSYILKSGQPHYFWLTIDVKSSAALGRQLTIDALSTSSFTVSGNKYGSASAGGTQTVWSPDVILATNDPAIAAASLPRGMQKNPIYAFNLTALGTNTLNEVTFTASGTNLYTNVSRFQLWVSPDNVLSSADQLGGDLAVQQSPFGSANFTFSIPDHILNDNVKYYFWITTDVRENATTGNTIKVEAINASKIKVDNGSVSGTAYAGGLQTISGAKVTLHSLNPAIPSGNVSINSPRSPIYRFSLSRDNAAGEVKITHLKFTTFGNYLPGNIDKFELWGSAIDSCPSATRLAEITTGLGLGEHTFTLAPHFELGVGETRYFWISVGTTASGSGKSIAVRAISTDKITITGADISGTSFEGKEQVIGEVTIQLSDQGLALSASDLAPNMLKRPLHRFKLQSCGNVTLTTLNFNLAGNYQATDISSLQLWTGLEDDLNGAAQLGDSITDDLGNTSQSFNNLNLTFLPGEPHYFWITVDAASSPKNGNHISIAALNGGNFSFSQGSVSGTTAAGFSQIFNTESKWTKARGQTINRVENAGAGHQVKVNVFRSSGSSIGENIYVGTQCREDFGDIRFFEGNIEQDYWMESCTYGVKAIFWVELRSNLSNNDIELTMRYANPGATTTSNGYETFEFFDDFNRTNGYLDDQWTRRKAGDDGSISIPRGANYVRLTADGTGNQANDFDHVVLSSDKAYNAFKNGAIEFRYNLGDNSIAELGFRGNFASNIGYKVRSDSRSDGSDGGESFLAPPYSGWEFLADSPDPNDRQPIPHIWHRGVLTVAGTLGQFYRDGAIFASTSLLTNQVAGEISLQNHNASKVDFDWVFVRKHLATAPNRSSWTAVPIATKTTAVNYNGFTARWIDCPEASAYHIEVFTSDDNQLIRELVTTNNAIRIDDLDIGISYYYLVKSECPDGYISPRSNTITQVTPYKIPGYGTSTLICNAAATVFVPQDAGDSDLHNNVVITPPTLASLIEDVEVEITHLESYDIWPNARLLASISSDNPSALNGTYTIHHDGITMPQAAAYRYAGGDWHQLDDAEFHATYTIVEIRDIPEGSSNGVLEIVFDDGSGTLPVELSSFSARLNPYGKVTIEWVTQTETNVMGYRIYRNNIRNLNSATLLDALIEGRNTSYTQVYKYIDNDVLTPGNNYYWLECMDYDGTMQYYGPVTVNISGDSDSHNQAPIIAGINYTYPNPFNPDVHITFGVPEDTAVKLTIYNIKGQLVADILSENFKRGTHTFTWTGRDARGRQLASGLYFLRMEMDKKTWIKKITMSK